MNESPQIIHELNYILQDLIIRIEKMPKAKKFVIGNILMENLVETINYCHEALQGIQQSKILASAKFNTFKLLIKMTYELKLIPDSIYAEYMGRMVNIGKMFGGWIRKI